MGGLVGQRVGGLVDCLCGLIWMAGQSNDSLIVSRLVSLRRSGPRAHGGGGGGEPSVCPCAHAHKRRCLREYLSLFTSTPTLENP